MLDVNDIYHELKDRLKKQSMVFNSIYIDMFSIMLYRLFSQEKIDRLFDASGDGHKPGALPLPPLHTGNGLAGEAQPSANPSTRATAIVDRQFERDGRIVTLRKSRSYKTCKVCRHVIDVREEYYTIEWAHAGLGAIKFPDRVHQDCLERYFEK